MSLLPELNLGDRRLLPKDAAGKKIASTGKQATINVAFTELRAQPDFQSAIDTQLIFGEDVEVFAEEGEWKLVKAERDDYVGWLEAITLVENQPSPTHLVSAPRTFLYPEPDMKKPHKGMRSMGSALRIVGFKENRGSSYGILETGEAVYAKHIRSTEEHASDPVSIAEELVNTPYLWAGTSAFGLDCSGLIKLAFFMCGKKICRDSDQQAATVGSEIDPGKNFENLKRGDLVFWKGHVGIMQNKDTLLHANGHSMMVNSEPLKAAVERISYLYDAPIGVRRP